MRFISLSVVLMALVTGLLHRATAAAVSEPKCGRPGDTCGSAPGGIVFGCPGNPGYCQAGCYCGRESSSSDNSKCLPIPQGCGKAGGRCCPSNADTPHDSSTTGRQPFCRDGSLCFYSTDFLPSDVFAGVTNDVGCVAVPKKCNTGPGSPCCPSGYPLAMNPSMGRAGSCSDNMFCDSDPTAPSYPGMSLLDKGIANQGTCRANTPDCGNFGKRCCISNSARVASLGCEDNNPTQKGFCADAAGRTTFTGAKYSELVCTRCPAKLDVTVEQDYHKYTNCGGA